jgi:mono/diheme cytochrome c family protein
LAGALAAAPARAQAQVDVEHAPGRAYFSPQERFSASGGAEVYALICQGCHMPAGQGAVGGGAYPALAANAKLASSTYLVYTVVNGRKGMPPFGDALDDTQIAQLATYLRTNFGNRYAEPVTAAEVKALRAK